MTRARRLLLMGLAVFVAGGATASAEPQVVASFPDTQGSDFQGGFSGPALAGSSPVWTRRMVGGAWRIELGHRDAPPTLLAGSDRTGVDDHIVFLAGASDRLIAWTDFDARIIDAHAGLAQPIQDELVAGAPVPGSPAPIAGCGRGRQTCAPCGYGCSDYPMFFPHVSESGLLYDAAMREFHSPRSDPVVRDFDPASGATTRVPGDGSATSKIAGRYVAYSEQTPGPCCATTVIVVYDWRSSRELYRTPPNAGFPNALLLADWALQSDGKLAVTADPFGPTVRDRPSQLAWLSPAEPTPHLIATTPDRHIQGLELARDRIAYESGPAATPYGETQDSLIVTDLAGPGRAVARFVPSENLGAFAFDGTAATWATRRCGMTSVVQDDDVTSGPTAAAPRPARACPRIVMRYRLGGHSVVDRAGRVEVYLGCPADCRGTLVAGTTFTGLPAVFARQPVHVRGGLFLRVPLGRAATAALRTRGRLGVELALRGHDRHQRPVVAGAFAVLQRPR